MMSKALCLKICQVCLLLTSAAWGQQADPVKVEAKLVRDTGQQASLDVTLKLEPTWHINPSKQQIPQALSFLIPTQVRLLDPVPPGVTAGEAIYPEPKAVQVNYTGSPQMLSVYEDQAVVRLPLTLADGVALESLILQVEVQYQACDAHTCRPPKKLALTVSGDQSADALVEQTPVESSPVAESSPVMPPAPPSMLAVLVLAFAGGMLLNVMPCVLPVIPIKILGLVQAAPAPGKRIALGLVMALGVLCFWLALGLIIAGLSSQRAISVLFGYWWFNMALGLFIVLLAFGMCGLFSVHLPRWVYAVNPKHDSMFGAFGFGIMTGVLATPCTGPFMGGAASVVLASGPATALAVFAAIGVGMAIPYFVLTAWPSLVDRLPRTGPASELIKQVLGLLMVAAGLFFIGVGVNALLSDGIHSLYQWYWWLAGGVIALSAVWMLWRAFAITSKPARRAAVALLALLMAGSSLGFAYTATRPSSIHWIYYTPGRLETELQAGHVVVLDFTADWCINCKVLERTVLESELVVNALTSGGGGGVSAIKVDLTSSAAPGWKLLEQYERVAIPLLVVLRPDGHIVFRQEVYTPSQVVEAIAEAKR
ncbi:MAG: hypothetical protein IT445_05640 [Phycisphaeraceae bacterium]|nr:hypothetical protein [Phycisphaeraceae bacterium]